MISVININSIRTLVPIIAAAGVLSCGRFKEEKSDLFDATLPSPAQQSQAVLGKGYNTKEERFAGDCVTGTTEFAGAPESAVNFERSLSATETGDSLGFAVGGKARYGSVQGSAAAKFASDSSSNDYAEATVYSAEYRFKNAKLRYAGLTEVGKKASQGGGRFVWENWEKTCGHEFVEQIRLGAKLMISAKVEFSTKEDKKAFSAEFKIKGPAFSASGELSKASRRFGKSASVSIRAYQLGGDVSRLSSIFGQGNDAKVDSDGKQLHALLVCSMDRVDACMRVLDSALSYATDTSDPASFPNQVKPTYDPTRPDGPAELAYITKPWSDLAFYPPPPVIAESVRIARADLSQLFEEQLKKRNRINALISGPFRMSPRQSANVEEAQALVSTNLTEIANGAAVCYTDVDLCAARVGDVRKNMKRIGDELLEVYPESFAQWCDALESGIIRKAAKGAVTALMDIATRQLDLSKVADKCSVAQDLLLDLREIDLSDKEIESLAPLSTMKNVQKLKLNRNSISDLGPLSNLTLLREISLNVNQVEELSPLLKLPHLKTLMMAANKIEQLPEMASMNNLEVLWLGDNKLTDLRPLSGVKNLKTLKLGNNGIKNISPIIVLQKLEVLDLSRNAITDSSALLSLPSLQSLNLTENPTGCPPALRPLCSVPL
jgi:hypothetical protein